MNYQEFSKTQARFLQRRYAISLGRRYVSAAASVIILGLGGYSKLDSMNSVFAQDLPKERVESLDYQHLAMARLDPRVAAANTRFGFQLFSEILKQNSSTNSQNISLSPSSVAIALAIAYNGASGETQQAMAKTLGLQGITLQELNSANAALIAALQNLGQKVELNIANSLWARQDYSLKSDFIQKNQNFYKAEVNNLNFNAPNAASSINNWVKQSTSGKINQIVDQINPNEALFLLNAIYFKGKWTTQFDKQQTTEYPFYLASGKQKQQLMMSQSGEYRYYENEKFQAVSLPYGKDGRLSLYVFLPHQNTNLSAFYQDLNAENWDKWMTQFSDRQGSIRLPRFTVESDFTLNDTLKALGMGVAFGEGANFSGIGENLALSEVKQKTFVEVNEEGTQAAAATSVGVELIAATRENQPFQMIVDRPFFCTIRDNQTGTVLFMGSIQEPQ